MRWCHRPAALAAELLRFRNAFFRFSRCWHLRTTLIVFKAHFYRVMRQGLEPVADTPVGSDAMLGISSSQRRQTTTGEGTELSAIAHWHLRLNAGAAVISAQAERQFGQQVLIKFQGLGFLGPLILTQRGPLNDSAMG